MNVARPYAAALVASLAGALSACDARPGSAAAASALIAEAPPPSAAARPAAPEAPTAALDREDPPIPLVASFREICARYKAAPNDIRRSGIFNENNALLARASIERVKGELSRLSTNHGGDELTLTIKVGDVEFTTEATRSPIRKGSSVYNAAGEMSRGQCVVFSANHLRAFTASGEAQVCHFTYFANFTALGPCA
jgi:hypothetical protein